MLLSSRTLQRLRRGWLIPAGLAAFLLLLPLFGIDIGTARDIEIGGIYVLLISSLNLTFGYAGEFAFSQIFTFMAGAYFAGYMSVHHGTQELLIVIPGTIVLAALVAIITGIPGLRLGSLSLAMVSFFMILLVPDIVVIGQTYLGGYDGLPGIPTPSFAGIPLGVTGLYVFLVASCAVWMAIMRNLVTSRHGVALQVMRSSPILATSLGIPIFRLKLTAYFLSGIPAGVAGALFAYLNGFVLPDLFNLSIVLTILAGSILGGSVSVYGAVIGAFLVGVLPIQLLSIQGYSQIIFGCLLVIVAILIPDGAAGVGRRLVARLLAKRFTPRDVPQEPVDSEQSSVAGGELVAQRVSRSFGGLKALDEVSLTIPAGRITAIVGPNGSGKTTLLNIISGLIKPDSGVITIDGQNLTQLPAHKVARLGVGRSFQTPMIPPAMRVSDVVSAALYERPYAGMISTVLRLPRYRAVAKADEAQTLSALHRAGVAMHAGELAGELALGTRRLVELARALVPSPAVMLLDEPASGLEAAELSAFADLLRALRTSGATIVLVEHNFPFVLSIADTIHVMDQGTLLRTGTPDEIAADPEVLEIYIGGVHANVTSEGSATE